MARFPRPPLSPEAAAVVRAMRGGRLSRRGLLGGVGALGAGAALSACASSGMTTSGAPTSPTGRPTAAADVSDTDKVVKWANWTLYLDKNDASKTSPTLDAFQSRSGIVPSYFEEIDDNETYYTKIAGSLGLGQDIGRDVIVLTDWMAGHLVAAGWTQQLDKAKYVPNAANILPKLRDVAFDPGRNHSLTWQSGYTGLGWNVDLLKRLTGQTEMKSLDDLWNAKLHGRVSVLSEMRDTIGLIMWSQGNDPSKPFSQDKFDAAITRLEKEISNGQVREVKGNSYKDDLASGDVVAAMAWSGDIFQLNAQARAANPSLTKDPYRFAIPEAGGMLWSDNLLIPIGATHKQNAEALMNYYYEPAIAAQVAAYVQYICPVQGAQTEIGKLPNVDPAVASSRFIFPTDADLANVKSFTTLTQQQDKDLIGSFQQVLGS
jgi:spermidine/putrescine transport system substrate-binding protein